MTELFTGGRIIDVILVAMLLEAAGLFLLRRAGLAVPALREVAFTLLAGALLLLALRALLAGAAWHWVGLCLLLALPAHVLDLYGRRPHAAREGADR